MKDFRFRLVPVTLLILLLLLAACQGGTPQTPAGEETPEGTSAEQSTPEVTEEQSASEGTEEQTTGEGTEENGEGENSAEEAYPAEQGTSGYPAPDQSGYPGPSSQNNVQPEILANYTPTAMEVPPPSDESKANLGGTLVNQLPTGQQQPYTGSVLVLGKVLLDEAGQKVAAGMTEDSPRTQVDEQGHFLFENIEPGEYAIFYWTPMGSVMLLDPVSGNDMLFLLEPGSAVDAGILHYNIQ